MTEAKDIVTQIQAALDDLSVSMYSTVGALQRDAYPVSIRGESVHLGANTVEAPKLAPQWAAEVAALTKNVDHLIKCLPNLETTEVEELQKVAQKLGANNEIGKELKAETAITEELLANIREMYAALADKELEISARQT